MNILLVSATQKELSPFMEAHGKSIEQTEFDLFGHRLQILITGVGMVSTTYAITKALNNTFDLVVHAGIAGSYSDELKIGDVVFVMEDCIVELGAEDGEEFISFEKMGFDGAYATQSNFEIPLTLKHKKVRGATVNKVHGNENSISAFKKRFNFAVETMEGAAVQHVCQIENIANVQIRAISNKVERRKRENWNIPKALTALSHALTEFLKSI